jgi:hypothetical protein
MPRRRRRDDWYDGYYDDPRESAPPTDVCGIVGLVLGIIAVVCLLLGCVTCGLTYFVAAPLALVGGAFSLFGREGMKVAGLALNVLTLIPGVVLLVLFLIGAGANAVAPPEPDRPQNQRLR